MVLGLETCGCCCCCRCRRQLFFLFGRFLESVWEVLCKKKSDLCSDLYPPTKKAGEKAWCKNPVPELLLL